MYNNKKSKIEIYLSVAIVILILIILSLLLYIFKDKIKTKQHNGKLIAIVNNKEEVYESDIKDRLALFNETNKVKIEDLPEEIIKAIISEYIVNNNIYKYAKKYGYYNNAEINKIANDFKNNLIKEKFVNEKIYKDITDDDILEEYAKLVESLKGKRERRIRHILVNSEEDIKRIRREVIRSGNFNKVAREKSLDKASAKYNGDLGYLLKDDLAPEFGNIAFILKVGEISAPIKTKFGWHIIKVEDDREVKILSLDESKESIKEKLQSDALQKFLLEETKNNNIKLKIKLNNPEKVNAK